MIQTKENITLKLTDLVPYAKNEKIHTQDNLDLIRASLNEIGYVTNIVVDENREILSGHGRYIVLKEDKVESIEVTQVTGLTKIEKDKYRLYDNQTSRTGKYNTELLINTVTDILDGDKDFSITKLGIEGLAESFSQEVMLMDYGKVENKFTSERKDVILIPTAEKERITAILEANEIQYLIGYENIRL
jgi:hypothetical protein